MVNHVKLVKLIQTQRHPNPQRLTSIVMTSTQHIKQRRRWQIKLLGLLLLSLVFLLGIPYFIKRIPQQLEQTIQDHLHQQNIHWAVIEAQGRNITLKGNAPTVAEHEKVLAITQQVAGVREITNLMTPRIINPYTLSMKWDGKRLTLNGFIDTKENYNAVLKHAAKQYGKKNVVGELTIGGGQPEQWTQTVTDLMTALKQLDKGTVDITNQAIYVAGLTPSSTIRDGFITTMDHIEQAHYVFDAHIVATDEADKICQQKFNILLEQSDILFPAGKAMIAPESYPLLDKLADTAALCPKANIIAVGHTDNQGDDEQNFKLSQARAKAMVSQLFQRGVPLQRMSAIGYGKNNPIASNNTEQGRARNRRIELIVKSD